MCYSILIFIKIIDTQMGKKEKGNKNFNLWSAEIRNAVLFTFYYIFSSKNYVHYLNNQ
jgi:hypothetical protein